MLFRSTRRLPIVPSPNTSKRFGCGWDKRTAGVGGSGPRLFLSWKAGAEKKERCAISVAQRSWCSLAPERREAAPVRSKKPHREAPAEVVDPETTLASKHLASTQEGGQHEYPAILRANGEASR